MRCAPLCSSIQSSRRQAAPPPPPLPPPRPSTHERHLLHHLPHCGLPPPSPLPPPPLRFPSPAPPQLSTGFSSPPPPSQAEHMLEALASGTEGEGGGGGLSRASPQFVRSLFDDFSDTFESKLECAAALTIPTPARAPLADLHADDPSRPCQPPLPPPPRAPPSHRGGLWDAGRCSTGCRSCWARWSARSQRGAARRTRTRSTRAAAPASRLVERTLCYVVLRAAPPQPAWCLPRPQDVLHGARRARLRP